MKEQKKVRVGQSLQNCFVTYREPPVCLSRELVLSSSDDYFDYPILEEEIQEDNSRIEKIYMRPYPHTPEAVSSYVDACNYRLDPLGSVKPVTKPNLGDVRDMQNVMNMDSADIQAFIGDLNQKYQEKLAQEKAVLDAQKNIEVERGNVNNG